VEDGIVRVEFVKSSDNNSDIFTENVNQEIYEKHAMKLLKILAVNERFGLWRCIGISLTFIHISNLYVQVNH
jgi:hypothetical protein